MLVRRVWSSLAILTLLASLLSKSEGWSGPFHRNFVQFINLTDTTQPFRQNWCAQAKMVYNGTIQLNQALQGATLNSGLGNCTNACTQIDNVYYYFNETSNQPVSGYSFELWNLVATKLGFTINWISAPKFSSKKWPAKGAIDSKLTYLTQIVPLMDVFAGDWAYDTPDRHLAGLDILPAVVDASLYLVTKGSTVVASNLWSFALPFTNELWGLLICTMVVNGIVFYIMTEKPSEEEEAPTPLVQVYRSLGSFAGEKALEGSNPPLMLLQLVFCFLLMILNASYTASLTTALVANSKVSTPFSDINDANNKGATLCASSGSYSVKIAQNYYPNLKLLQFPAPGHIVALEQGLCDGAILANVNYQIATTRSDQDWGCDLTQTGTYFRSIGGGYPSWTDYSDRCTSFLSTVLSEAFMELQADGSFDSIWSKYISIYTDLNCPAPADPSISLGIKDMAGIFVLYSAGLGVVLIMFAARKIIIVLIERKRAADETKELGNELGGISLQEGGLPEEAVALQMGKDEIPAAARPQSNARRAEDRPPSLPLGVRARPNSKNV